MDHYDIPGRSLSQQMDALEQANIIRAYRASLKKDIKAGKTSILSLLLDPPEKIETMKVFELLLAVPKYGRVKIDKIFRTIPMSTSKTVGGMSDRQRNELLKLLRR